MNSMNENLVRCESKLERHQKWIRDQYTWIVYDKIKVFSEEIGCNSCLDMCKCKFANHILDVLDKKENKAKIITKKDEEYYNALKKSWMLYEIYPKATWVYLKDKDLLI